MQTVLVMLKDFEDTPKVSAKERATPGFGREAQRV